MTPMELLTQRASCKSYTAQMPPLTDLEAILEAGRSCPTGMNRQPLAFLLVTDPQVRDRLSRLNAEVLGMDHDPFYGAPALIAVLADPEVSTCLYDGSLAMGQLLLGANALGYGSCWIHRAKEVFHTEEGKAILQKAGLPADYEGIGFCIIGTPRQAPVVKEKKSQVGRL